MRDTVRPTLTLPASAARARLPTAVSEGTLVGETRAGTIRRVVLPLDQVAGSIGPWLVAHGLYSQGNDFTSEDAKRPGHVGNSTLKMLWEGVPGNYSEGMDTAELYILLNKGTPLGVVCLIRSQDSNPQWFYKRPDHLNHHPKWRVPVARLGNLMAFMAPQVRGQGACNKIVREFVIPGVRVAAKQARQHGAIPLLGAADAMNRMAQEGCDIPVTEYLAPCRAMYDDLWRIMERQRMNPERSVREVAWLVERQPCPKSRPKLRP